MSIPEMASKVPRTEGTQDMSRGMGVYGRRPVQPLGTAAQGKIEQSEIPPFGGVATSSSSLRGGGGGLPGSFSPFALPPVAPVDKPRYYTPVARPTPLHSIRGMAQTQTVLPKTLTKSMQLPGSVSSGGIEGDKEDELAGWEFQAPPGHVFHASSPSPRPQSMDPTLARLAHTKKMQEEEEDEELMQFLAATGGFQTLPPACLGVMPMSRWSVGRWQEMAWVLPMGRTLASPATSIH